MGLRHAVSGARERRGNVGFARRAQRTSRLPSPQTALLHRNTATILPPLMRAWAALSPARSFLAGRARFCEDPPPPPLPAQRRAGVSGLGVASAESRVGGSSRVERATCVSFVDAGVVE